MGAHGNLPAPPDTRPYRRMSEDGAELVAYSVDGSGRVFRETWKQIGWQGQSGAFYALERDARPADHEPGSFSPIWVMSDSDEWAAEDLAALLDKAPS
jgi:hypothetical protein